MMLVDSTSCFPVLPNAEDIQRQATEALAMVCGAETWDDSSGSLYPIFLASVDVPRVL